MQLYVIDKDSNKVVRDITSNSRTELAHRVGKNFYVKNALYNVNQVFAKKNNGDTTSGAVIGGGLGLFGGGLGVLIGSAGGLIGGIRDREENELVNSFNAS